MSTMVLLEDHPRWGRRGDVVTVPYLQARDLERGGIARRWGDSGDLGPAATKEEAHRAAIARLEAEHAQIVARLEAELEAMRAEAARIEPTKRPKSRQKGDK